MKVGRRPYELETRAAAAASTGERILDAAILVFWDLPSDQISLDEVATRAGVSVQTVIRRFGGKHGLLTAAAHREATKVADVRDEAPVGDAPVAVRLLVDHYELTGDRVMKMLAEEQRVPGLREIADLGRAVHRQWCSRVWEPLPEPPEWLSAVEGPIVLVTTSSQFQNDGRLVIAALEALADEPATVVATVPAGTPDDYTIPANAHLEKFLPHGPLLERAACAITHGGMGATQKTLAHGVPVCAVPFGRDQFEVARRVEVAGAGTFLPASLRQAGRMPR